MKVPFVLVICKRCGATYTFPKWKKLPLVGYQSDDEEVLELRNCSCGSTHSVVTWSRT